VTATLNAAKKVTVSGVLNLGANTGLTLADGITTPGTGKIIAAIPSANVANMKLLLDAAGSPLNIEQGAALTLTAATTVKADTVLTLTSGALTADNTTTANLTVAGTVVLDGGSIATGTSNAAASSTGAPAINISGSTGSIVAGDVVISGAGALYEATASAKLITITKANGFVGVVAGKNTLKGATKINAGNGKVILSVVGGTSDAAAIGTFASPATDALLTIKGDTIDLDSGTEEAAALTISDKGSLAVNSGGIIGIKSTTSTLVSTGTTAKLSIASGAKLSISGTSTGSTATFTKTNGTFGNGTGTFSSGSGSYTAKSNGWD
jgi:hypothetical protein